MVFFEGLGDGIGGGFLFFGFRLVGGCGFLFWVGGFGLVVWRWWFWVGGLAFWSLAFVFWVAFLFFDGIY